MVGLDESFFTKLLSKQPIEHCQYFIEFQKNKTQALGRPVGFATFFIF